ncbi:MAG: hypothetical protein K0R38_5539 [Polyangiaceae bacterium]|jgi:hypothetical protein|nr:hypothetical protein [Polyangiaceae bacterium]
MTTRAHELNDVLSDEVKFVRLRRRQPADPPPADYPLFGVALSGGGVRSGTVSLGFLQVLHSRGLLSVADYLSSVSGGGYASGYLLAAARVFKDQPAEIFGVESRKQLIAAGQYLAMGGGGLTVVRTLRLLGGVVSTTLVNLAWMFLLLLVIGMPVVAAVGSPAAAWGVLKQVLWYALFAPAFRLVILGLTTFFAKQLAETRFARHSRGFATWVSKTINTFEGITLTVVILAVLVLGLAPLAWAMFAQLWTFGTDELRRWGFGAIVEFSAQERELASVAAWLIVLGLGLAVGFLASSDVIGINVLFRDLVDSAYLRPKRRAGWRPRDLLPNASDIPLKDAAVDGLPYPLFGGGSYLRGETRVAAKQPSTSKRRSRRRPDVVVGTKVMDYFLLSPLFCGSETSAYAKTSEQPYASTTLADAVATSAASISPLWDGKQNVFLSWLLFVLNMNLGVWLPNPRLLSTRSRMRFLFRLWPVTYVQLIVGKLTTERPLLHVADGGFVDNLGLIELLRRRCRIILAVDSTFDPRYHFSHLRNVVARAATELGTKIEFSGRVEDVLRPSGVTGFSERDHVLARITYSDNSEGYLIYCKATLRASLPAREGDPSSERAAGYPTYHEQFPQESTGDQFFDADQWNAYNGLGQQLAESALATALGSSRGEAATPTREALLARLEAAWAPNSGDQRKAG